MKMRRAWEGDLPRMNEIDRLCYPQEKALPGGMFLFHLRHARILVAEGDSVVGFIIGYTKGKTGAIKILDIDPGHQRRGIGRRLMGAMEEELSAMGALRIHLEAAQDNCAALSLYHQGGYSEGQLLMDFYGRGRDAWRLWKDLNGASGPDAR
jgi:ribosomal-protein-alanine N-acetyltransferase